MAEPRILFYDIETTHNIVASFRLYGEDYLPFENIIQERIIICAAWKWQGERTVQCVATFNGDDTSVCEALSRAIKTADVIVAHNGNRFDSRFLATRLLYHRLPPIQPAQKIDTCLVAKHQLLFNCNKLDYLGQFLGVGKKQVHPPGLWLRALKYDRKAIEHLMSYNKQDVRLLERVYRKLRPYIPDHLNRQLITGGLNCPRCGSKHISRNGVRHAITRSYARWQCQACGGWFRDVKPLSKSTKWRVL